MNRVKSIVQFLLICVVISGGCTTINMVQNNKISFTYVDRTLKPFLDMYYAEAEKRGITVDRKEVVLVFGHTKAREDDDTIGFCAEAGNVPQMVIDEETYQSYNQSEREMLILHEIGHCVGKRDHCEVMENKQPISLMYSKMFDVRYYDVHREGLMNELFFKDDRCQ